MAEVGLVSVCVRVVWCGGVTLMVEVDEMFTNCQVGLATPHHLLD